MICTNILFLKILYIFNLFLQILRFVVPIGLIGKIVFDFYHNMISSDKAAAKQRLAMSGNRIVAAIIVFLIPSFIKVFISFIENTVGISADYQSCLVNINNISYYEELEQEKIKQEEEAEKEKYKQEYQEYLTKQLEIIKNNKSNNAGSDSTGTIIGQRYELSPSQLRDIAKVCQNEQGNATGAAAEASLMANRFELYGIKYGIGADGFYKYVMKSDWWAPAKYGTYKSTKLEDGVLAAVREVLVYGIRTLPLYVDEHDWVGDISKIVTNGKTYRGRSNFEKHSNYVKDKTIIYNKMTAIYTYYTHPTKTSDPFGYTKTAMNKISALNK